jgi:hypothetical protein
MARASGLSVATVGRVRRAFGLQPHRSGTFELSTDPLFAEPLPALAGSPGRDGSSAVRSLVRDIVGLYPAPPERALVPCVAGNSRVQALDRTPPLLPPRPGQAERPTHDYARHDYARHGTASLFAALDLEPGKAIGRCFPRHRAAEFRRFPDQIDAHIPPDLEIRPVRDDPAAHKTKAVRDRLARRPRYHVHFTPASASRIGQVERWFGLPSGRAPPRGVHRSVAGLERAIRTLVDATNAEPEPFRRLKSADDIPASVKRFRLRTLAGAPDDEALARTSESGH